jgi:hypothetical protein
MIMLCLLKLLIMKGFEENHLESLVTYVCVTHPRNRATLQARVVGGVRSFGPSGKSHPGHGATFDGERMLVAAALTRATV